jgi:hypothetical protein
MFVYMTFNLPLGLDDKPQAGAIAYRRCKRANREGAKIPEWIEQAWAGAELLQARLAPGEVIRFLASSVKEQISRGG